VTSTVEADVTIRYVHNILESKTLCLFGKVAYMGENTSVVLLE